jgi:hypothetical protein
MNVRGLIIGAASLILNRRRSCTPAVLAFVAAGALACGSAAPAQADDGWQGNSEFDVPTGRKGQQYGRDCPVGYNAVSGAFAFNDVGQEDSITLSFNGPRIDEATPDLRSWGWHFWWPNGAKAGETILFNIYCIKT